MSDAPEDTREAIVILWERDKARAVTVARLDADASASRASHAALDIRVTRLETRVALYAALAAAVGASIANVAAGLLGG